MANMNGFLSGTMGNNQNGSWNTPGCRVYYRSSSQIYVEIASINTDQGTSSVRWSVTGYKLIV